ncbi:PREDICTED: uncharacterized protein LOC108367217 [Rhagoletis zephyria]|uniref:uncharacterized protein LOC108367217 n=1 Tax=Rhagoletis zephyria TaxID=28612 RepID=UPI000811420C|nr:PREDICTED: uncharacterized protein LOC108367217 [Rhagoletis zephyria]
MTLRSILLTFVTLQASRLDALIYPQSSTLGLVHSVSYPVVEYLPERSILIDWCFQMSYALPPTVSAFYNIPIWPGIAKPKQRKKRAAYNQTESLEIQQHLQWLEKYKRKLGENQHPMDLTAGELYRGIEDYLESLGLDDSCLLRSVCELAQHPFDDRYHTILTELLTFVLTPSLHQGFANHEQIYQETYVAAELHGFLGENCTFLYADCQKDLLSVVTKIIQINV